MVARDTLAAYRYRQQLIIVIDVFYPPCLFRRPRHIPPPLNGFTRIENCVREKITDFAAVLCATTTAVFNFYNFL